MEKPIGASLSDFLVAVVAAATVALAVALAYSVFFLSVPEIFVTTPKA